MRYTYLIFDVDDTLLDFSHAYFYASEAVARKLGIDYSPEYADLDKKASWKGWYESGLADTGREDVQQQYHAYYFRYLQRHFAYLLEALGMEGDAEELVECYLENVAASCAWMEEKMWAVFQSLAASYKLVLATNGLSRVQRPRMRQLIPLAEAVYISEEMGTIKPASSFFEKVLTGLGCPREECLMIGDSLSNDITGAMSAGMSACWYNPKGKAAPENVQPTYVIHSIEELPGICRQAGNG